jgi:hypothetical protein
MKRTVLFLVALLVFALMPAVAGAQTSEELAAIDELEEAIVLLAAAETTEEFVVAAEAMEEAIVVMKAVFPDLDYAALDAALDALDAAILGGDLGEINAAADAVIAEAEAVAAAAAEAAGGGTTTTTVAATTTVAPTTTIAEVVTDIPDGGSGPNVALLGMAALLVLLSGAALRASVHRR